MLCVMGLCCGLCCVCVWWECLCIWYVVSVVCCLWFMGGVGVWCVVLCVLMCVVCRVCVVCVLCVLFSVY